MKFKKVVLLIAVLVVLLPATTLIVIRAGTHDAGSVSLDADGVEAVAYSGLNDCHWLIPYQLMRCYYADKYCDYAYNPYPYVQDQQCYQATSGL